MNITEKIDNYLNEGTGAQPNTKEKALKLQKLMKRKITKKDARNKLYNLIGDDDFYDSLNDAIRNNDSDIRQFIKMWLKHNGIDDTSIKGNVKGDSEATDILKNIIK